MLVGAVVPTPGCYDLPIPCKLILGCTDNLEITQLQLTVNYAMVYLLYHFSLTYRNLYNFQLYFRKFI